MRRFRHRAAALAATLAIAVVLAACGSAPSGGAPPTSIVTRSASSFPVTV
jgi:hypothetical protein